MAFGQVFKKRGGAPSKGESTFETSEEVTEVPDISGIMDQIDRNLNKTRDIIVEGQRQYRNRTMEKDSCQC